MIFIILIAILVINCISLNYNLIPLVLNVLINNVVFYLNFIFFIISINNQKNKYGINKSSLEISYAIPFDFIIINYAIRHTEISKPFSDFFGYFFIENDLNSLLNKSKNNSTLFFLKPFYYILNLFNLTSKNLD